MASNVADKPEIDWSFWSGQVVDNQLNPIHLSLGVRGYQIQSALRIPERWGIFSAGPPRLQAYEGQAFVIACSMLAYTVVHVTFLSYILFKYGKLNGPVFAVILGMIIASVAVTYYGLNSPRQRAPGYVWDDWKMGQEYWD
ncbi:hypothetical protein F5Y10DRAFT_261125 [Nemania abortiva]|nr:hypothetical protein F5Y10DRAFT_261125 [Nemania abortiva]